MIGYIPTSKLFNIFFPAKIFKNMTAAASYKIFDNYIIRFFDILGAIIGLILSSALFLILPILIKLDSKGPVFYTQLRVGRNRRGKFNRGVTSGNLNDETIEDRRKTISYGESFTIYKFRTMKDGAEKKCGPVWASDNDPRITQLGRILRATHLDELPQLINILKGDMSFVGPRPERPHFVDKLVIDIPRYAERLNIKPGLTGLAQVKTGYDYSIESVKKKLFFDLEYCQNGNLRSYFKIVFLTLFKSLIGKIKI